METPDVPPGAPETPVPALAVGRAIGISSLAGCAWFACEFGFETWTSSAELTRTLRRLTASRAVRDHTRQVVETAGWEVLVAYLGVGALGGALLGAVLWPWMRGRARAGVLPWLGACLAALAAAHGLLTLWLVVRWPGLFPDWEGRTALAEGLPLGVVEGAIALCGAAAVYTGWSRWGRRGRLATVGALGSAGLVAVWPHRPVLVPDRNEGPNVILIGLDALRPDRLASAGYPRDTAPHLDRWLAGSWWWTRSYTPLARTHPSWMSLLTGRYPHEHGVREDLPPPGADQPRGPSLVDRLRDAGYHTAYFTDDSRFSYMTPEGGWGEVRQPPPGARNIILSTYPLSYRFLFTFFNNPIGFKVFDIIEYNQAFSRTYRSRLAARRFARDLVSLRRHPRFLAAVHLCVAHSPRDTPWPYYRLFGMDGYRGANRFRYKSSGVASREIGEAGADPIERDEGYARQNGALYDAGLRELDDQLALILGGLGSAGLLDRSIVVLWSDHGEDLGESRERFGYRGPNHGFHPFGEAQHRVLVALRLPGGEGKGVRDDGLARTIDVAPTLLDVLDLPPLPGASGHSRRAAASGGTVREPPWVYGETGISKGNYWTPAHRTYPFRGTTAAYDVDRATGLVFVRRDLYPEGLVRVKDRWVQDREWKLVSFAETTGPRYELFHVPTDPGNLRDVAAEHPDRVRALAAAIESVVREDPDATPEGGPAPAHRGAGRSDTAVEDPSDP